MFLNEIFGAICKLSAYSDLAVQNATHTLNDSLLVYSDLIFPLYVIPEKKKKKK